jgi:hypothetical protein
MRFSILADFDHEAGIDIVMDRFIQVGVRKFSRKRIMAVPWYSRKEEKIYMDLMLDYNLFVSVSQEERDKVTAQKMMKEVPPIVRKYKLPDFNYTEFESDLPMLMSEIV